MPKLTLVAALTALVVLGIAAMPLPAAAASTATCQSEKVLGPNGRWVDVIDLNADGIAMELRQRGYAVESVQGWGGCVKAFIKDGGGKSHMEFFDPFTLAPLTTN